MKRQRGFTLVEVLVALGIVALALMAGTQAASALVRNAQRQSDLLLAQLCAENALVRIRLARQMPGVGDTTQACEQGGQQLEVDLGVRPTPNPSFLRVDASVRDPSLPAQGPLLRLSTIVGRY
jgi:general secretion pathway protein I